MTIYRGMAAIFRISMRIENRTNSALRVPVVETARRRSQNLSITGMTGILLQQITVAPM